MEIFFERSTHTGGAISREIDPPMTSPSMVKLTASALSVTPILTPTERDESRVCEGRQRFHSPMQERVP
jgi:hypothetical protein